MSPYRPYTVVLDVGKPVAVPARTVDDLERVLRDAYQKYVVEGECPEMDVIVYDDIDQDISETTLVAEIVEAILEEQQWA
jgi:hypothetical protein